jgi:hypothetical protein
MEEKTVRKIAILICVVFIALALMGCGNRKVFNTQYRYDYIKIYTPGGELAVDGKIEWWQDHEDGTLDVSVNGDVFLVHSMNVIMSGKQQAW